MNDVVICGDSFADPKWPDPDRLDKLQNISTLDYTWPNLLAAEHNVTNFAVQGTGPDYSLTSLRHWMSNRSSQQISNTDLIFICSAPERLDLRCYSKPSEQVHIYDHAAGIIRHKSIQFAKWAIEWYFTLDWADNRQLMYYSTMCAVAPMFKSVLYWPISRSSYSRWTSHVPTNLIVPTELLIPLSTRDNPKNPPGADIRPNHFQKHNHKILHEQINSWIIHSTAIDTSNIR